MEKRGVRDEMVIATKVEQFPAAAFYSNANTFDQFTSNYKMGQGDEHQKHGNYTGNSHKSLHLSLEASLKKLKTSYIGLVSSGRLQHRAVYSCALAVPPLVGLHD